MCLLPWTAGRDRFTYSSRHDWWRPSSRSFLNAAAGSVVMWRWQDAQFGNQRGDFNHPVNIICYFQGCWSSAGLYIIFPFVFDCFTFNFNSIMCYCCVQHFSERFGVTNLFCGELVNCYIVCTAYNCKCPVPTGFSFFPAHTDHSFNNILPTIVHCGVCWNVLGCTVAVFFSFQLCFLLKLCGSRHVLFDFSIKSIVHNRRENSS